MTSASAVGSGREATGRSGRNPLGPGRPMPSRRVSTLSTPSRSGWSRARSNRWHAPDPTWSFAFLKPTHRRPVRAPVVDPRTVDDGPVMHRWRPEGCPMRPEHPDPPPLEDRRAMRQNDRRARYRAASSLHQPGSAAIPCHVDRQSTPSSPRSTSAGRPTPAPRRDPHRQSWTIAVGSHSMVWDAWMTPW